MSTDLSADAKPFYPPDVRKVAENLARGVRRLVMIEIICDNNICRSSKDVFTFGPWIYSAADRMEIKLCQDCYNKYYDAIVEYWNTEMYSNYARIECLSILDATTGFPYTGDFMVRRSSGNLETGWRIGFNPYIKLVEGEVYVGGLEKPGEMPNGEPAIFTRICKLSDLEQLNRDVSFTLRTPPHFSQILSETNIVEDDYEYVDETFDNADEANTDDSHFEEEPEPFTGGW